VLEIRVRAKLESDSRKKANSRFITTILVSEVAGGLKRLPALATKQMPI